MERPVNSQAESSRSVSADEKPEPDQAAFSDKEQLKKDLSGSYLSDLDFQLELEDEIQEDFSKTKNPKLRDSLLDLRARGENSLRDLSSQMVKLFNSNKLVVRLRDNYIAKRGRHIFKEVFVNNELAQPDDYDQFIKMIQSDFWGTSSEAGQAARNADQALGEIARCFPEKTDEILKVWPTLFCRDFSFSRHSGFSPFINQINFQEYSHLTESGEKVDYIKKSDDFVALSCLTDFDFNSPSKFNVPDIDVPLEVEKRLDSIVARYPGLKEIPSGNVENLLFRFASRYPERILTDSRRVDFIFRLWINNASRLDFPLAIAGRLKTCSEAEGDLIFKEVAGATHVNNLSWILDQAPVSKKTFKAIKEGAFLLSTPRLLIDLKREYNRGQDVSEKKLDLMIKGADNLGHKGVLIFISNLIVGYPSSSQGIDEAAVEKILVQALKVAGNCFDLEDLHGLSELMKRHQWSDNLKNKVFAANNIGVRTLNSIFGDSTQEHEWLQNEPELLGSLEHTFYERARSNEIRHYFYEVLDNKRKTDNFDALAKSYGQSGELFDLEEIKNLFLSNRIERKYLPYFINGLPIEQVLSGIDAVELSRDDKHWLLENTIKHGQGFKDSRILEKLFELEDPKNLDRRRELIDDIINQTLVKTDDRNVYEVAVNLFSDFWEDFLSLAEMNYLRQEIMVGALNLEDNYVVQELVFKDPKEIKKLFPDEEKRREYLSSLLDKLTNNMDDNHCLTLVFVYFGNEEIFSILEESYLQGVEEKIFSNSILKLSHDFLKLLPSMNARQEEAFKNSFLENYTVVSGRSSGDLRNLCDELSLEGRFFRYQDICRVFYLKLLKDPDLDSYEINRLFNEKIIFGDKEIRTELLKNIFRWPKIDGVRLLEALASRKGQPEGDLLAAEEVKKISTLTVSNRGLSPRFWRGYLASSKEDPAFYLDADLFRVGLDNLGEDCFNDSDENLVAFIRALSQGEFEFSRDDEKEIIRKTLLYYTKNVNRLEVLYRYSPELTEEIMAEDLERNLYQFFKANIKYSGDFYDKLIDQALKLDYRIEAIKNFLDHLQKGNSWEEIPKLKNKLSQLSVNERTEVMGLFLKYDLLTASEAKEFYQQAMTSASDNVQEQILISINIIGSLLSNHNNIDSLENFLDEPRPRDVENLKDISNFIEKYQSGSKGRGIAVMLFAREFLPERSLEEVIGRVAGSLKKYEEILQKNSYQNIPSGFRASIGMEYEITSSTARGYQEATSRDSLANDIELLSEAARIGSGNDAVHEIATRPTDNPYLMILEMKLIHELEYIDFNFNRSENYQKGARGFHLTLGGEKGLAANYETNFLQNAIVAASWGGVQAGETGHKVNGGRGVSIRNRDVSSSNNVAFFEEKTGAVELRSLSIDKQETWQRAVTTAFNGAIAIQAFKDSLRLSSLKVLELLETDEGRENIDERLNNETEPVKELTKAWIELISRVDGDIKKHNTSFLDQETFGYLDRDQVWVDSKDFGGEYNRDRFRSVVASIDPTVSLEEYAKTMEIDDQEMFGSFNVSLSDKLTKLNNLYLKPGVTAVKEDKESRSVFKGDQANARSMLEITKLGNQEFEGYDDNLLEKTIFDSAGEKRKGYYYLQGASEQMLTHAIQRALLDFNSRVEQLVN